MKKRRNFPVSDILREFNASLSLAYVLEYADCHYSTMNSAQTTFASRVKRLGFNMIVRTSGRSVVVFQMDPKI